MRVFAQAISLVRQRCVVHEDKISWPTRGPNVGWTIGSTMRCRPDSRAEARASRRSPRRPRQLVRLLPRGRRRAERRGASSATGTQRSVGGTDGLDQMAISASYVWTSASRAGGVSRPR